MLGWNLYLLIASLFMMNEFSFIYREETAFLKKLLNSSAMKESS